MANGENGILFYETSGSSMRPLLLGGEKLVAAKCPASDLRKGDLVIYKSAGKTACHRFVKKEGAALLIRGDFADGIEAVPEEAVMGRVTLVFRNGKIIYSRNPAQLVLGRLVAWCPSALAKLLIGAKGFFR